MKLLAFAATSSKQSINRQIMDYASRLIEDGLVAETSIKTIDLNDYEMPIYSIDREQESGIPAAARAFFDEISEVDLNVDFLPAKLPKGVSSRVVAVAYGYLVVPSRSGRKKRIELADMGDEEFIAYPSWTQHREIQNQALSEAGVQPKRITEVGTADSMLSLVAAGLGYTLVPWLHSDGPKLAGTWSFKQERLDASFPIQCAWAEAASQDPMLMTALAAAPLVSRETR